MNMSVPLTPARPGLLIVDDEPTVRAILAAGLSALGFDARAVADGSVAVALVTEQADASNLALIDLYLPAMDGLATAAALRRLRPQLSCCLMSGGFPPDDEALRAAGVARYFPKPLRLDALAEGLLELAREAGRAARHNG